MSAHEISPADSLVQRVQSLPAELYMEIYDLTFTINVDTCLIDKAYKPPSILQVNKRWRSTLRYRYYDKTIFEVPVHLDPNGNSTSNDVEDLIRWLTILIRGRGRDIAWFTLHILSDIMITTPIRRNEDESNDVVVLCRSLTIEDRRHLGSLRDKVSTALLDAARPDAFNLWTITENKMRFRCLTDTGREIWWDFSMRQSSPTLEAIGGQ